MLKTGPAAPELLRQYVERIERLEEEKQALMADIREVYSEAKGHGLNPKIMRQVVKLRSMDRQDLMELDAELETYRAALDLI
ncbi:MAG: DUF2312 domain-containing protein [Alphaproteobacteria bacterium]|nr:DUF2312 domain-containing protein [Alphaproteobacteria bacterium]